MLQSSGPQPVSRPRAQSSHAMGRQMAQAVETTTPVTSSRGVALKWRPLTRRECDCTANCRRPTVKGIDMTEQHRKDTSLDTSLATSLLSIRNWLEAALEAKGAKVEGA